MDCPLNKEVICTNWVCTKHGCQRLGGSTLPVENPPMIDRNKQYRTRDGREVRIYATDGGGEHPVHGGVFYPEENAWGPESWTAQGLWVGDCNRRLDLIEVKPRIKREVWVNVYQDGVSGHSERVIADNLAIFTRIACVRLMIDCEEGQGL